MEKTERRQSVLRLVVELAEEIIILGFVELKLAAMEIKRNIRSVEKGAAMMAAGAGLLLFALVTFIGTSVAVLAIFLPIWLSALIVALTLTFFGIALLFTGLGHFKDFSLIPSETLQRVEDISQKYKKVSARHQGYEGRRRQVEVGRREPETAIRQLSRSRSSQG
jgi:fatty acid desaturase